MRNWQENTRRGLGLVVLISLMGGCFGLMNPNDKNRGIIVSDYPVTDPAPDKWACYYPDEFSLSTLPKQNIVIDSDSSFRAFFDYAQYTSPNNPANPCLNFRPEPIDFSRYTLLGNYASGGCEVGFTRNVERDDRRKTYVYQINVREAGSCKRLEFSMNWVLVPKLPTGYTVEFRVK